MPALPMPNRDATAALSRVARWAQRLPTAALALAAAWVPAPADAQAELVADINLGTGRIESGRPGHFARLGAASYFSACDLRHGCELWRSDGTEAGTTLVADICPGPCSSNPAHLAGTSLGLLLFAADDGQHGSEPWLHDPADGQTRMVADLAPGGFDASPSDFVEMTAGIDAGTGVYFLAGNAPRSVYLLRVDSTPYTLRTFSLLDSLGATQKRTLVAQGSKVFFIGGPQGGATGMELWALSREANGSFVGNIVRDIHPGPADSNIGHMIAAPALGGVFFSADDGSVGNEPWVSDGTAAGTRLLFNVAPGATGSQLRDPVLFNDRVRYLANDGAGSLDLWSSNLSFTQKLQDFDNTRTRNLRVVADQMLFMASTAVSGLELWRSAGTSASTMMVRDFFPGPAGFDAPAGAVAVGGYYYFGDGPRLFRSDGTAAGTRLVGPATGGFRTIDELHAGAQGVLYSFIEDAVGQELFGSRVATPDVAGLVRNIAEDVGHAMAARAQGSQPGFFQLAQGRAFFAYDEADGFQLRGIDAQGAVAVLSDAQLIDYVVTSPGRHAVSGGRLFFLEGFDTVWVSDGSAAGTYRLADFAAPPYDNDAVSCVVADGDGGALLLARVASGSAASELWRTDGTAAGTVALLTPENLPADTLVADRFCPARLGTRILLNGLRSGTGFELYSSDGTPGQISLVRDVAPGSASGMALTPGIKLAAGRAWFVGNSSGGSTQSSADLELWVSDGSAQGTRRVLDINPTGSASPHSIVPYADGVAFVANDGVSGYQLWRSDGTAAGTLRLSWRPPQPDIALLPTAEQFGPAIAVDGARLFVVATLLDPQFNGLGAHLFVSQGQAGDLRRVVPATGVAALAPQQLSVVAGAGVVFAGFSAAHGRELWFSDGSDAGTLRATDVAPGALSGGPLEIAILEDGVYFSADDGPRGREPWRLPIPRADAIFASDFQ